MFMRESLSFCTCAVMSVLIRHLVTDIFHSCRLFHFDMDFDAVLRALTNLVESSIELVFVVVVVPHRSIFGNVCG